MYVRNPLIAGVVSIPVVFAFLIWTILAQFLMLEFYWSVLPIIVACFVSTWWAAPQWLSGVNKKIFWLKPVATIGITFVAIACVIPFARVAQVPEIELSDYTSKDNVPFAWGALAPKLKNEWHQIQKERFEYERKRLSSPSARECAELYQSALKVYRGYDQSLFQPVTVPLDTHVTLKWIPDENKFVLFASDKLSSTLDVDAALHKPHLWPDKVIDDFVLKNKATFDLLDQADGRMDCFPVLCDGDDLSRLKIAYLARHEHALRKSDLQGALRHLLNGITTLIRLRPMYIPSHRVSQFLDRLGAWAEHPDQTPELLLKASNGVLEHYNKGIAGELVRTPMMWRRHGMWIVDFDQRVKQLESDVNDRNSFYVTNWLYRLPWERTRARRLAEVLAVNTRRLEKDFASIQISNRRDLDHANLADPRRDLMVRLTRSSGIRLPDFRYSYYSTANMPPNRWMIATVALKMDAIRFRLEKGHYPGDLEEWKNFQQSPLKELMQVLSYFEFDFDGLQYRVMKPNGYNQRSDLLLRAGEPYVSPFEIPRNRFNRDSRNDVYTYHFRAGILVNYPHIWKLPEDHSTERKQ